MRFPAWFALALVSASCLDPIAPGDVDIGIVRVTIGSRAAQVDTIQVRATTRARAVAFAREGYDAGITRFTFTSSNHAVATVDSLGTVRGVGRGEATITATAPQGVSGSARVVVLPSSIAYTIPVGASPGAIAFSTDFARAYVATSPDSVVILDALGFFRVAAIDLDDAVGGLAATSSMLFATHPAANAVSVVATGSNRLVSRLPVGDGPGAIVASGERAFVALRGDRRVLAIDGGGTGGGVDLGGGPTTLTISGDGSRLFAGAGQGDAWQLVHIDPGALAIASTVSLGAEPTALATNADGRRVWVLHGAAGRVDAYDVNGSGAMTLAGTASVGSGGRGLAVRMVGPSYLVVSGTPTLVLDGATLTVLEEIVGAGGGWATARPDGLFAFLASPGAGAIHVIRM